tara:strand:+ start:541 stop:741 length:201 start_codon:yes stop_codon:yes gene_type:complete
MSKFTVNNKEYTHKELNLMWDFFTEDQWDLIVTSLRNIEDDDADSPYNEGINPTIESIQQLWRSAY